MSTIYWQPELETLSRNKLQELQLEKLKATVARAAKSPYYGQLFREMGITADSIMSLEDVRKLPMTVKQNMRDN